MTEKAKKRKDEATEGSHEADAARPEASAPESILDEAGPEVANDTSGESGEGSADLAALLEQERQRTAEMKEKFQRVLADVENVRRRHERELDEARKYAVTGFARDLLEVADNFNRALQSVPDSEREQASEFLKNLLAGIEMTEKSLHDTFERHRIWRIDPQPGEKFDPNWHQAMFEVPHDQLPNGTVAQVMQVGYGIADRTLRPALVGVAKAQPANEGGQTQGDDGSKGAAEGDGGGSIDTTD